MNLCDWCGSPVAENAELCAPCLKAQADVANARLPATPEKQNQKVILERIKNGLVLAVKGTTIAALSVVMVITALLGTCSAAATIATIANWGAIIYLLLTAFWVWITYILFRSTQNMIKTPVKQANSGSISASSIRPMSQLPENQSTENSESNPNEIEGDDDELKT